MLPVPVLVFPILSLFPRRAFEAVSGSRFILHRARIVSLSTVMLLLLDEVLNMDIMGLEIFNLSETF